MQGFVGSSIFCTIICTYANLGDFTVAKTVSQINLVVVNIIGDQESIQAFVAEAWCATKCTFDRPRGLGAIPIVTYHFIKVTDEYGPQQRTSLALVTYALNPCHELEMLSLHCIGNVPPCMPSIQNNWCARSQTVCQCNAWAVWTKFINDSSVTISIHADCRLMMSVRAVRCMVLLCFEPLDPTRVGRQMADVR